MKLRHCLALCALLFSFAGSALAASSSAPAYLDIKVRQNTDWREGLSLEFMADEKICREQYGKTWQNACSAFLGESGEIVQGVELSPATPGIWRRDGTRSLRFIPERALEPSTMYTVDIGDMSRPASVKFSRTKAALRTLPAAATMTDYQVWVDPSERNEHRITANLNFLYPVDKGVSLLIDAKTVQPDGGLKIGSVKQIWNAERDGVTLSVPLLSLPGNKSEILFSLAGHRLYTQENGKLKFSRAESAEWIVPVLSSPFAVQQVSLNQVETEDLDKTWEIAVELNRHTRSDELMRHMKAAELPLYNTPGATQPYDWTKAGYMPKALITESRPLALSPMQPDDFASNRLRYRVAPQDGRCLFVNIEGNVRSSGGLTLSRPWLAILKAPNFSSSLSLLQPGNILPLGGDKKLDIQASGLDSITWRARYVRRPFLALLGALGGSFDNPTGGSGLDFGLLSQDAGSGSLTLPESEPGKAQFAALDLSPLLSSATRKGEKEDDKEDAKGMLQISLSGIKNGKAVCSLERFLVVTDMGLMVKQAKTGELYAYVCTLSNGHPADGVNIKALSKNGVACAEAVTREDGCATLPPLSGLKAEAAPVVVIAEGAKGDLAWLPLKDTDRRVFFASRGEGQSLSKEGLTAYVFSQRGVYRPGETLYFGGILRRGDMAPLPGGLPLKAVLLDPAGREIHTENFTSNEQGLNAFAWKSPESARTGRYRLEIRLPGQNGSLLGSTSALLEEFFPETMRMKAEIAPKSGKGWLVADFATPKEARATLMDLYGAPSADRRVSARLFVEPAELNHFAEWPEYTFYDPFAGTLPRTEDLPDMQSAEDGSVSFPLPEGLEVGSVLCRVELRGFEAGGGRSVSASAQTVLSPGRMLIGYRPDGSVPRLDFLPKDHKANLHFIAVDPNLQMTEVEDLNLSVSERRHVSNLTSDNRGFFRYAEVPVDKVISRARVRLDKEKGFTWPIPTDTPGDYVLHLSDAEGKILSVVEFTVVGERLRNAPYTTGAGLRLKLSKEEYARGENIDMSLSVPYDGAGLITLERDSVFAHRWFTAKAGDTVQSIRIPDDFEGRGYVTISFARAADSQDVYLTPFACVTAPFTVGTEDRDLGLRLQAAPQVEPGQSLKVRVEARKPGKAILYAVDEGILQLTRYKKPDPLHALLKDRALDVVTLQAFDLVMPDHGVLKSRIPGFGGGDGLAADAMMGMQNPFKRQSEPPLVWWSGLMDIPEGGAECSIPLPDYCGTTLRLMAVGCSESLLGSTSCEVVVRGNRVLTPQLPVAVAPGDVFEAALAISAPQKQNGPAKVNMQASPALKIEGETQFEIPAGTTKESVHTFKVRVKDIPGDASITFTVEDAISRAQRRAHLSVRPAVAKNRQLSAGVVEGSTNIENPRDILPNGARTSLTVSALPLPAVRGLASYLDDWGYGCTEQLISKAFPYVLLRKNPALLTSKGRTEADVLKSADERIEAALSAIMERRGGMGKVAFWPRGDVSDFVTVYAADFLISLREEGIAVPTGLAESVCDAVETFAGSTINSEEDARLKAYACWVLCREGRVMTRELEALYGFLHEQGNAMSGITPLFLAASLEILHMNGQYPSFSTNISDEYSLFDPLSEQAFHSLLTTRHFPHIPGNDAADLANAAMTAIQQRTYNTFSSAQTIRALLTVNREAEASTESVELSCSGEDSRAQRLSPSLLTLEVPLCKSFNVNAPAGLKLNWLLESEGFDRVPPREAVASGMEITKTFLNEKGEPVTEIRQGDILTVLLEGRAYGNTVQDCVIADLLPGCFEQMLSDEPGGTEDGCEVQFTDRREDRMILFATLGREFRYTYRVKAVTKGVFTVPAVTAESMYDRMRHARSASGSITVK